MATSGGPFTSNEGLIFGMDTGHPVFTNNLNTRFFKGRPTTNLSSGYGMSTYNNVGSHVTSILESTSETFQGATVIKQTLIPLNSTGVSYLSGGNNPGIGVVTGGGGGTANTYTGHSIFFKPTVPMHSAPIYTNYSNIGGWQSSTNYEYVGDGWYRAHVVWYNTVTQSDGKYWAINPQSATVNRPIVIYWAGPFKESLNVNSVSPYIHTSRGNSDSLIDLTHNTSIDVSNVSFTTNGQVTFDGTNDFINTNVGTVSLSQTTLEAVVYRSTATGRYEAIIQNNVASDDALYVYPNGTLGFWPCTPSSLSVPTGQWTYVAVTYNGSSYTYYVNGNSQTVSATCADILDFDFIRIGAHATSDGERWIGQISVAKVYNRALSSTEISQNYQGYKNRFGI